MHNHKSNKFEIKRTPMQISMFLHVYETFYWCEILGGELTPSIETPEVGFFAHDELPPISVARVIEAQIQQFFDMLNGLPEDTYFD